MRSLHATEQQVRTVQAPEFTKSWHPMDHNQIIEAMYSAVNDNNMAIVNTDYALTKDGANMFATWTMENGGHLPMIQGTQLQLGIRNSINKAMAVGITAGTKVMVCSNMCFSGDYIQFRKHTSGLTWDELHSLAQKAVYQAIEKISALSTWQESLKEIALPEAHRKLLTYDAMVSGALSPSKFNQFIDLEKEEIKINGNSVYSWHGAGTRACRESSLFDISKKTPKLNSIAAGYVDAIRSLS
jgi:hypothetical protein